MSESKDKIEKPAISGIIRNPDGTFRKGVSGNPEGKPVGTISILNDIKSKLERVKRDTPEKYQELIDYYWQDPKMRDLLLRMIDGNPKQSTDLTSGGEKIDFNVTLTEGNGDNTSSTTISPNEGQS